MSKYLRKVCMVSVIHTFYKQHKYSPALTANLKVQISVSKHYIPTVHWKTMCLDLNTDYDAYNLLENYVTFCTWALTGSFIFHFDAGMSWIPLEGTSSYVVNWFAS